MSIVDLNGNSYTDVHALEVGEKDLIIFRSDRQLELQDYEQLSETILASNKAWKGGLLVLKTDESIEKLDAQSLLQLYLVLKTMFEKWEDYAAMRESKERACIRCGQSLDTRSDVATSATSAEDTVEKSSAV